MKLTNTFLTEQVTAGVIVLYVAAKCPVVVVGELGS
jgi:hypothetical protein